MRVKVAVTDESGRLFEGEAELVLVGPRNAKPARSAAKRLTSSASNSKVELDLPLRPFLKKYAKGKSGPAKFALLLAHLASGKSDVVVEYGDIQAAWNRATSHLGPFNPAHTTRAKDNGWVDSPKQGQYVLRASWTRVLAE